MFRVSDNKDNHEGPTPAYVDVTGLSAGRPRFTLAKKDFWILGRPIREIRLNRRLCYDKFMPFQKKLGN